MNKKVDWTKPVRFKDSKITLTVERQINDDLAIVSWFGVCDNQPLASVMSSDRSDIENTPPILREIWVNVYPSGSMAPHHSKISAEAMCSPQGKTVLFREVIED
jgi:hypothetical protein